MRKNLLRKLALSRSSEKQAVALGGVDMTESWRQEKNASAFFELPAHLGTAKMLSPLPESALALGNGRFPPYWDASTSGETVFLKGRTGWRRTIRFFDMREGVTLLTAAERKQMVRKIGFQQSPKIKKILPGITLFP